DSAADSAGAVSVDCAMNYLECSDIVDAAAWPALQIPAGSVSADDTVLNVEVSVPAVDNSPTISAKVATTCIVACDCAVGDGHRSVILNAGSAGGTEVRLHHRVDNGHSTDIGDASADCRYTISGVAGDGAANESQCSAVINAATAEGRVARVRD